jgi:8-oxo-dGTP diphosphatase
MGSCRVRWVVGAWLPTGLPVTQVYGFCFRPDGDVLLLETAGGLTLPGGKPEAGEDLVATLRREAMEEARVTLGEIVLIGHQVVEGDASVNQGRPYAQLRAVALLDRVLPPAPDPATGEQYRRRFRPPALAVALLNWTHGAARIGLARAAARRRWGIGGAGPRDSFRGG